MLINCFDLCLQLVELILALSFALSHQLFDVLSIIFYVLFSNFLSLTNFICLISLLSFLLLFLLLLAQFQALFKNLLHCCTLPSRFWIHKFFLISLILTSEKVFDLCWVVFMDFEFLEVGSLWSRCLAFGRLSLCRLTGRF